MVENFPLPSETSPVIKLHAKRWVSDVIQPIALEGLTNIFQPTGLKRRVAILNGNRLYKGGDKKIQVRILPIILIIY